MVTHFRTRSFISTSVEAGGAASSLVQGRNLSDKGMRDRPAASSCHLIDATHTILYKLPQILYIMRCVSFRTSACQDSDNKFAYLTLISGLRRESGNFIHATMSDPNTLGGNLFEYTN